MRVLLRILFCLMILVGLLLAVVYPWSAATVGPYEIGRHTVYQAGQGRPAEQVLEAAEAPVSVSVAMEVEREFRPEANRPILTVRAATGDRTVLSSAVPFADAPPTKPSPQAREATYRAEAGRIEDAAGEVYTFTVEPAEADGIDIRRVEIVLRAGAFELDARAQPAGFVLLVLSVIGLVLTLRRLTGRARNKDDKPSPPRWGRG